MKLAPEVLAELIDIFRTALVEGVDVSDRMRSLDLNANPQTQLIELTADWLRSNRRQLND
jgi:hypothetical protein